MLIKSAEVNLLSTMWIGGGGGLNSGCQVGVKCFHRLSQLPDPLLKVSKVLIFKKGKLEMHITCKKNVMNNSITFLCILMMI